MTYWKYKAYDSTGDVIDGVATGIEPLVIVTELRQEGLQVFDLVTIPASEYHTHRAISDRLRRLRRLNAKASGQPAKPVKPTAIPPDENPAFWSVRKVLLKRQQRFIRRMTYAACLLALILLLLLQLWFSDLIADRIGITR